MPTVSKTFAESSTERRPPGARVGRADRAPVHGAPLAKCKPWNYPEGTVHQGRAQGASQEMLEAKKDLCGR